jgi:hypothetical protein
VWIDKGWLVDYFGANVQTFFYFTKCVMEFFCIIFGSLERTLYLCKKQCMGFRKRGIYDEEDIDMPIGNFRTDYCMLPTKLQEY